MRVDPRKQQAARAWLDRDGRAIDTARAEAAGERQRGLTRRAQALLAAAGMDAPCREWFVLKLAPGSDKAVDRALGDARVEHWMPVEKPVRRARNGVARMPEEQPALRGYLFIHITPLADHWHGIMSVEGVVGVLGGWERPWPVAEREIAELRRFFGLSAKERRREAARHKQAVAPIGAGDDVVVTGGPMAGRTGKVERAADSVSMRVILDLFGGRVPVSIPLANLSKSA